MKVCQEKRIRFFIMTVIIMLLLQLSVMASEDVTSGTADMVYVNDFADVLSDDIEAELTKKSRALDELTGAQFVVVTVDFLGGKPIKDYATDFFNKWQIGDAAKNNGLLLLLAVGEEDYYVIQGKGLDSSLSNNTISSLLNQYLEADFASGNYEAGVQKTYTQLFKNLEDIYEVSVEGLQEATDDVMSTQPVVETNEKRFSLLVVGIAISLLLLCVLLFFSQRRVAKRRRKRLRRISR